LSDAELTDQSEASGSDSMIDVVCGVVEDGNGNILVCRRPAGKHLGGMWEFPGGKIDSGETPSAALIRELTEELGIEVAVGHPLPEVIWPYESVTIRLIPYRCQIVSGEPRPLEHDEIRWCPHGELATLKWAPADVPILAGLERLPAEIFTRAGGIQPLERENER
jgi:8-oxo-dGTP diphosphatase